jgi:nucleoid DNA-binding protein
VGEKMMIEQELTWDEWIEDLGIASGGEIDYWYLSEDNAKIEQPELYKYYQMGYDLNDFVSERLMSYEGGDVIIWLDPDELDDNQLDAILSNTNFHDTFSEEIKSLIVLNNIVITNDKAQKSLKRQIYIGAITCLETYLSDAFINTVLSNKKYLQSFFCSFKDFETQKLSKNQLFTEFNKAEETATKAMSEVIYHNLPKVSNMYKSTLNISFPEFGKFTKYVETRHDLVHRNGKNTDGKEITINYKIVDEVINDIKNFVNEIDQLLQEKNNCQ